MVLRTAGKSASFGAEAVADSWLSEDVLRRGTGFNLLAKLIDKYPKIFCGLDVLPAPHGVEKGAMGKNFSRMPRHINEKIKFLRREMNFMFVD